MVRQPHRLCLAEEWPSGLLSGELDAHSPKCPEFQSVLFIWSGLPVECRKIHFFLAPRGSERTLLCSGLGHPVRLPKMNHSSDRKYFPSLHARPPCKYRTTLSKQAHIINFTPFTLPSHMSSGACFSSVHGNFLCSDTVSVKERKSTA